MWVVYYIVYSQALVGCRIKQSKFDHGKIYKKIFKILSDFQDIKRKDKYHKAISWWLDKRIWGEKIIERGLWTQLQWYHQFAKTGGGDHTVFNTDEFIKSQEDFQRWAKSLVVFLITHLHKVFTSFCSVDVGQLKSRECVLFSTITMEFLKSTPIFSLTWAQFIFLWCCTPSILSKSRLVKHSIT